MAEVSPDGGIDDGRGPVGIGIVPITVEDHQPGAFALDAVERRARRLGERPRCYRQLDDRRGRAAEADDHVAGPQQLKEVAGGNVRDDADGRPQGLRDAAVATRGSRLRGRSARPAVDRGRRDLQEVAEQQELPVPLLAARVPVERREVGSSRGSAD